MIDKILDFHLTPDGTAYYQIKWKTSWERADSLSQFGELLDEFWAKVKKASTANMFNNASVNRKEPAIVPRPKPTTQQSNNTQQKNAPRTPTQKKRTPSTSHTPRTPQHQQQQQQQQQQFFQQSQQIQQMQSFQPPPQQPPPATQSMGQPSSVTLIDSDDDDDDVIAINPPPSGANNMSFNSMNPNNIKLEDFDQKPQLGFPPQPFAGGLPPQQQSFMNPTNGRGGGGGGGGNRGRGSGGTGGRGRGRGRGSGPSPAKRKLGMPPAGSATPPMKMEPQQMGGFGGVKNENGGLAPVTAQSSWKDHFEVLENYVDGQKVHSSYKCLHCNAKIAQSSNCSRHLKTHLTSEEAEHECPICQKKFARLDYIERHLKQHGKGSTEEVKKMIKLVAASMKK